MTNPLKTEHAIDWGKTAQEIEDQFQAGMIERDRYRNALEAIVNGRFPGVAEVVQLATEALMPSRLEGTNPHWTPHK